jgi:dsRNA-specific ribonuclease
MTVVLLIFAVALGGCAMNDRRGDRRSFDEAEIRAAERALEQAL